RRSPVDVSFREDADQAVALDDGQMIDARRVHHQERLLAALRRSDRDHFPGHVVLDLLLPTASERYRFELTHGWWRKSSFLMSRLQTRETTGGCDETLRSDREPPTERARLVVDAQLVNLAIERRKVDAERNRRLSAVVVVPVQHRLDVRFRKALQRGS